MFLIVKMFVIHIYLWGWRGSRDIVTFILNAVKNTKLHLHLFSNDKTMKDDEETKRFELQEEVGRLPSSFSQM